MDHTEMQDFQANVNLPRLVVQNLRDHGRAAAVMAEFNRDLRRKDAGVNVGIAVPAPSLTGGDRKPGVATLCSRAELCLNPGCSTDGAAIRLT